MGDPAEYLPDCSVEDIANELSSIGFPEAQDIAQLSVHGAYHRIFRLAYSATTYCRIIEATRLTHEVGATRQSDDASTDRSRNCFIFRVSGSHISRIKTAGEVGILTYLKKHTSIPVPQIVHYNDTTSNILRREYMIMTFLRGQDGSKLYPKLSQPQFSRILDQLVTICLELYKLNFEHIGGLRPADLDNDTTPTPIKFPQCLKDVPIVPGPPLLETMWQCPDIDRHFNSVPCVSESFASLNAISPDGYPSYSAWLASQMRVYIRAITVHPSLSWVRNHPFDPDLGGLVAFTTRLESDPVLQASLDRVPLKLAHRDLHFGNLLLSPSLPVSTEETKGEEIQYDITGVIDWEFACVLPFPLWRHSFLYSGISPTCPDNDNDDDDDNPGPPAESLRAQERRTRENLFGTWAKKAAAAAGGAGHSMMQHTKWSEDPPGQEAAWDVVNYVRCVVEVCPRENKRLADAARGAWWDEIRRALACFDIEV